MSAGGAGSWRVSWTARTFESPGNAPADTTAAVPEAAAAGAISTAASMYSRGSDRSMYTGTPCSMHTCTCGAHVGTQLLRFARAHVHVYCGTGDGAGVTRRKQQRPGIAPNDTNHGTHKCADGIHRFL